VNLDALAKQVTDRLVGGLNEFSQTRERTGQGRAGYIGPSDLGFCRHKALLTMKQEERHPVATTGFDPEDGSYVETWPADVGSAIHDWIEQAFEEPDDVLTGRYIGRVTATFPRSRATVSGTPDLVIPGMNLLLDVKSKNRLELARREGVTQNNVFQRHTYALGLIERGILTDDGSLLVGNVFFDRSGKDRRPWVTIDRFDPTLTDVVDQWIEDVIYARLHNEDASRDVPSSLCPYVCEFFQSCRGGVLEDTHDPRRIDDPEAVRALALYAEGMALQREGKGLQDVAKTVLTGVSGVATLDDGTELQLRWTHVNATEFKRSAYDKIDVRKVRSR
jgi:hypothetical protein